MKGKALFFLNVLLTLSYACHVTRDRGPKFDECGYLDRMPTLIHSLPQGRPVYGVQPYKQEIYVIRDSTPYIEVYDRNTFQAKRNITIDGLQGPYDMVQSNDNPVSLFIADWFDANNLTVVQIPGGTSSKWSTREVGFTTLGLAGSNTVSGPNILVTAATSQKVKAFSLSGNIVTEVVIQNISSPRQSIKVSHNRYAVCHGYGPPPALHRVCLVGSDGQTVKCYGSTLGSGTSQLNIPSRLELNRKNCILVGDVGNKRIVLLNKDVDYVKDLINTGLDGPYRLFLDEENSLLYVADNQVDASGIAVGGRVLVFKVE